MNNATRHNQGKRQLSFILSAPNALKGASAVMEFGADKYGEVTIENAREAIEWSQHAGIVTRIARFMSNRLENVELATINGSGLQTLSTSSDSVTTNGSGTWTTGTESQSTSERGGKIPHLDRVIEKVGGITVSKVLGSHKKTMIVWLRGDVCSVAAQTGRPTLTTAIKQADSGAYFAVGATTDWGCLETISLVLEELSLTSKPLKKSCKSTGRDNWKKGLDKHQIIDSLMRHLLQHLNGEKEDAESGLDHLFHVLTNAIFLAEQYGIQAEPNKYVKEVSLADFWQPGCPPPAVPYNSIPCTNL